MAEIRRPKSILVDIAKWRADTMALTAAERGAFLSLKMFYWSTGPIVDNDQTIAQITGMELKDWRKARKALESLFIVGGGEWLRADWNDELSDAYAAIKKYSDASKTANKARWEKQKTRVTASGSESGSHPPSLLKYTEAVKVKSPSQQKDGFDYSEPAIEQAVSGLESGWNEKPFIMAGGFGAVEAEKGAHHGL